MTTRRLAWLCVLACSCSGAGGSGAGGRGGSASARPSPAFAAQPGDTAITDATVVPMSSEGALTHHTVVIRGDRIVAVAPSAAVAVPPGVTMIDGAGKWLMPGLADMHVHTWADDDLTMFLAAGVTTIRNMWGVPQHLTWRSQIARAERLGPTIVTAGPLLDGDPPDWPGSIVLARPADADKVVTAIQAAGYDFLKSVSRLSRESYEALAAAGKRHGMALSGHVPIAVGLEGALGARQRSIEHLDGYLAALVPHGVPLPSEDDAQWTRAVLAGMDPSRLPGLIAQTIAAGTWNCPTLIVYDRTPLLYDTAAIERRVKWLGLIPAAVRAQWVRDYKAESFTAEESAAQREANAQLARIAAALVTAGAPVLIGSDTGVPFVVPGEALHDEIELMVAGGAPRQRVLRAATADAWRYLGLPREAGVVEVGARADLVLVASDPLTAPLPLIPDGVMVRGTWLPRGELEARLAEIAKRRASPPQDAWTGAPPLAAEGKVLHQARYDAAFAGTMVGQERVAVGLAGGKRTIAGQITDFDQLDTSYRLGPDTATVAATYHTMRLELASKITAGKLVVTGTDLAGQPVSLSEPVPAGAFLSGPGMGGAIRLAGELAAMKPGSKRTLTSLELGYFPAIGIASVRYDVERRPDAGGHRVFAVAATQRGATVRSELVIDNDGFAVTYSLGPPVATTITRRPQ